MKNNILTWEKGRKFSIGFLIFCFGLSNINAALATDVVEGSPIIVQPYDLADINQQMLEQDRVNRDQELAIRGLIDDNQRLADTALARQQDATLEKINQTLVKYRDYLVARDQLRITANSQRISKYHDLISLTEEVDGSKDVGQALQLKSDVIEDKYKILTELKEEMIALNEKLKGEGVHENFVQTPPQQNDKIQMLTQRLAEMDQRIAHFDAVIAEKDQEIAQLKDNLTARDETISKLMKSQGNPTVVPSDVQAELKAKDETIRWLNQVLLVAKNKAEYYQLTSQEDQSSRQQIGGQLSQKQQQVDLLKSELENKITEANGDDRLKLARQLINLQQKAISLLEEMYRLTADQNTLVDQHVQDLEDKIKGLVVARQNQAADSRSRMDEFRSELDQREEQVQRLKTALTNKIAEEKNQAVLADEIQDLKGQLQDKENHITAMKATIQSDQETQAQADTLKQQLADQQNKVELLKQELDSKTAQSSQMTLMMADYQKKLESKDNAYNQELGQVLSAKTYQAQMEKQIADLNTRLQDKEAQVVRIKKDMYDLQESSTAKDRDFQAKDLSLSMTQEKASEGQAKEIKGLKTELALARQQLSTMPSSDEIEFLRTGLKNATVQLKQKDDILLQTKANADEYQKEFKKQSLEFQSLKDQLQDANDDLNRRNEDLKYKKLELARFKEQSATKEDNLLAQIRVLTRKFEAAGKKSGVIIPETSGDAGAKLKQALDKIDEQGRIINVLVKKLQDVGQSVDLTKTPGIQ